MKILIDMNDFLLKRLNLISFRLNSQLASLDFVRTASDSDSDSLSELSDICFDLSLIIARLNAFVSRYD